MTDEETAFPWSRCRNCRGTLRPCLSRETRLPGARWAREALSSTGSPGRSAFRHPTIRREWRSVSGRPAENRPPGKPRGLFHLAARRARLVLSLHHRAECQTATPIWKRVVDVRDGIDRCEAHTLLDALNRAHPLGCGAYGDQCRVRVDDESVDLDHGHASHTRGRARSLARMTRAPDERVGAAAGRVVAEGFEVVESAPSRPDRSNWPTPVCYSRNVRTGSSSSGASASWVRGRCESSEAGDRNRERRRI